MVWAWPGRCKVNSPLLSLWQKMTQHPPALFANFAAARDLPLLILPLSPSSCMHHPDARTFPVLPERTTAPSVLKALRRRMSNVSSSRSPESSTTLRSCPWNGLKLDVPAAASPTSSPMMIMNPRCARRLSSPQRAIRCPTATAALHASAQRCGGNNLRQGWQCGMKSSSTFRARHRFGSCAAISATFTAISAMRKRALSNLRVSRTVRSAAS
mmetsp:Transcript_116636/g.326280  ORF Transcript_116636/g.326280 Transcript_116636/m.326280 type:complete len:213 (-) Transcript_116636:141-779(-)